MISILLVVIALTVTFAYFLFGPESKTTKFINSIPGSKTYPIVGNAVQLAEKRDVLNQLLQWQRQFGGRYRIIIGPVKHLVLTDMADLKKIIESPLLLNKGPPYSFFRSWLGNGLLVSKGNKWKNRRKILTHAFHFKMLEVFQQVSNEQSMVLVELMRRSHENHEGVPIHYMFSLCALGIICEAAMGTKLRCQEEPTVYTQAVIKQTQLIFKRCVSPWLYPKFIWSRSPDGKEEKKNIEILRKFIYQIIAERKTAYKKEQKLLCTGETDVTSKNKRLAFLDLLIEIQSTTETSLTDEDIYDETATFTFEGHDTTAAGLTWSMYLLSKHPEYQEQVHRELETIFGSNRTRPITTLDLSKMKYLECCIKESLRLYPSVPSVFRKVEQDFQLVIPAGINIMISPWVIHRKFEFYPDPEKFIPERHTLENSIGRHPYAYMPFLAGSRNCIGQKVALIELKTVLANVLRNFKVRLENPKETVNALPELIVRPENDINVLIEIK